MSEERMPWLSNPHPLAFLEDPHHYICHLAGAFHAALRLCSKDEQASWLAKFRRRAIEVGVDNDIYDGDCIEYQISVTLGINNTRALDWARVWIALGLTTEADRHDPASVINKLHWPVQTWCSGRDV